jgi:hypothetical protein
LIQVNDPFTNPAYGNQGVKTRAGSRRRTKVASDIRSAKVSRMTIAERFLVASLIALALAALAATSHDSMAIARLLELHQAIS